ncbi:nucleotide triphosphate diphosphatase NUDT15 [Desulfatitalea alkaliphila]|uniref:NUDIX hydrolase n=1 Tax=Desulfatitalea alkaliphila TaxID=2929485 RepID=A0AA41QZQ1_9BACT|nr:NUDIX hydrolase [Desulfatitalea alkaliphila]MCJ8500117.1 NUDIX hydrolase [Desulfatitalea alkaliphila]
MDRKIPLVGVGVIVIRNGLFLLGLRKGTHGAGTWALPGGHLEYGESVEECARREVREETGLVVRPVARGPYTSDLFAEADKHYVTLFVVAACGSGEPRVLEPDRCEQWRWCRWSDPPRPLFAPLESLLRTGFVPQAPDMG